MANNFFYTDIVIPAASKLRLDGSASGNTHISESAADTLNFTTNGSTALTINSSQNANFAGAVETNGYLTLTGQVTPQIFMDSTTTGTPIWTLISRNDGYFIIGRSGVSNDFSIDPSGNATFAATVTAPNFVLTGTDGFNLPSGGFVDWGNGDARIVEGLVNNYSLSFQTYDGSALNTALRLDGNNTATFAGEATFAGNVDIGGLGATGVRLTARGSTDDSSGFILEAANSSGASMFYVRNDGFAAFAGNVSISSISNATSDTDKFLVSDSGEIKYRTGAEVRSDIGAGTGTVNVSGGPVAKEFAEWTNSDTIKGSDTLTVNSSTDGINILGNDSVGTSVSILRLLRNDAVGDDRFQFIIGSSTENYIYSANSTDTHSLVFGLLDANNSNIEQVLKLKRGSGVQIPVCNEIGSDTDKFLMVSGTDNLIEYVTGANLLSFIGGAPASGGNYLPLAGGTLTGALAGTSATFSGNIGTGGVVLLDSTKSVNFGNSNQKIVGQDSVGLKLFSNNTETLTLDNSSNATFAGSITAAGDIIASGQASPTISIASNTASTGKTYSLISRFDGDFEIRNGSTNTLLIDGPTNSATFAGSITATLGTFSSTTDQILNLNSTDDNAVYTAFKRSNSRIGYIGYGGSGPTLNIANELDGQVIIQNTNGTLKLNTDGSATFSGQANGITPTSAANLTRKDYVDSAVAGVPQGTITGNGVSGRVAFWSGTTSLTSDADLTFDGTNLAIGGNIVFDDNSKAKFGTGLDLEIYHDGLDSFIKDSGTGNLTLISSKTRIQNAAGSANCADFIDGGAVELYHNGSKKFETTSAGVEVTGGYVGNGEMIMSNSSDSSVVEIGDVLETDGISQIKLKTAGSAQMIVDDGSVDLETNVDLLVQSGDIRLLGDANINLDVSLASGQTSGTILPLGSGSVVAGKFYYFAGLTWSQTNANNESDSKGLVAYAKSSGTPSANRMLVNGVIYKASHGFVIGNPLYLSTTAGNLQATAPSGTNDVARVVGYAIDSNHIFFRPDNTWVKIS